LDGASRAFECQWKSTASTEATGTPEFHNVSSDDRFALVLAAVQNKRASSAAAEQKFTMKEGKVFAVLKSGGDRNALTLNEKLFPGLTAAVVDLITREIPRLEAELAQSKSKSGAGDAA
jgi:hypothetical protein